MNYSALLISLLMALKVCAQTPQLFQNIHPGTGYQNGVSNLYFGEVLNGKLYFNVRDSATGNYSVYATDGTVGGTTNLKTIPQVANFKAYNNAVYFGFVDVSAGGSQLWKTDGTVSGTQLVKQFGGNAIAPNTFAVVNGKMFFIAGPAATPFVRRIYISDGTAAGTDLLSPSLYATDYNYGFINNKLIFSASANIDSAQQKEPYITDGTTAGTTLLKDINPGQMGSNPKGYTTMNGKIYFHATTATEGNELWATDGTTSGTQMVTDLNPGVAHGVSTSSEYGVYNNKIYFRGIAPATGVELYSSDGTAAGTQLVKEIIAGTNGGNPFGFVSVGSKLIFVTNDNVNGSEIWSTDGTTAGTSILKDINAGSGSAVYALMPQNLLCNNALYFDADDGNNNIEPWVTDGTAAGTVKLGEINTSTTIQASLDYETIYRKLNGKIFFSAYEPVNGKELYTMNDPCLTGIIEKEAHEAIINLYPNPAKNTLTISTTNVERKANLAITNALGQLVFHTTLLQPTQLLHLPALPTGMYLVTVTNGQERIVKKLTIQ